MGTLNQLSHPVCLLHLRYIFAEVQILYILYIVFRLLQILKKWLNEVEQKDKVSLLELSTVKNLGTLILIYEEKCLADTAVYVEYRRS